MLKDPKSINKLKNDIRRHNPDILHFNLDSKFIYELRHCSFFFNKLSDKNKMKHNQEELNFLIDYENNFSLNTNKEENHSYIFIIKDYFHYFRSQKIIKPILDNRALQIDSLLKLIEMKRFLAGNYANFILMHIIIILVDKQSIEY